MSILKAFRVAVLMVVLLGSFASLADPKLDETPVYIDVRSWAENQLDGIDGDLHIHYPDIVEEIAQHQLAKDKPIYLYCGVGGRAEQARQSLMSAGYSNVINLGGIKDVKAQRGLD